MPFFVSVGLTVVGTTLEGGSRRCPRNANTVVCISLDTPTTYSNSQIPCDKLTQVEGAIMFNNSNVAVNSKVEVETASK